MRRRHLTLVGALLVLLLLFADAQANAQRARFRYVGGRWSHARHAGWHRYWGGPSIGFYYAPSPVYLVPGYSSPSYYTGTSFWYSNPSFGLSVNLGGGGSVGGGGGYRSVRHYNGGGHFNGGHGPVGRVQGGHGPVGHAQGGHDTGGHGGGHSSGDRDHR